MSITPRTVRLLTPLAAALFLGVALAIRAVDDGPLRQHSGTALYASMVWAGVLFVRPRLAPLPAGLVAVVFCWLVECAQLTGIPAELSARSVAARLALGVQFDPVDLAWYPAGVAPLVALHLAVRRRRRTAGPVGAPIGLGGDGRVGGSRDQPPRTGHQAQGA
ncbi:ribosomal maturation YjgA family protein [Micromonospora psammae]|uniref:ribosomal maturation YjgA family protein n=1 Tax=Micromonospora sp. CPCC 205556 TaxID=3122398 RepID=UPI002FF11D56